MALALPAEFTADDRRIVSSLVPELQTLALAHWQALRDRGLRLQFNSGRRSAAAQADIVARTSRARTVSEIRAEGLTGFAAPSNSLHLDGLAYDGEPAPKSDATWQVYGMAAESLGLEWGGRWQKTLADGTRVTDRPHVQIPRDGLQFTGKHLAGVGLFLALLIGGALAVRS